MFSIVFLVIIIVGFFGQKKKLSAPSGSDVANTVKFATINTNKLNMRSCPTTECGSIAKLTQGAKVKIIDLGKDGWWKIERLDERGQRQIGYVSGQFLKQDE